jgi:hypothetical protein
MNGIINPLFSPKLEDHTLLSLCNCLFKIFAATLHSQRKNARSRFDKTLT